MQFGFLILMQQMYIRENVISWQPCSRPAERVAPPPAPIVERWVDLNFPATSGIHAKLEAAGYLDSWIHASRFAGLEYDAWELVIEPDRHGMPNSFHVRTKPENMVYVKKLRR